MQVYIRIETIKEFRFFEMLSVTKRCSGRLFKYGVIHNKFAELDEKTKSCRLKNN